MVGVNSRGGGIIIHVTTMRINVTERGCQLKDQCNRAGNHQEM